MNFIQLNKLFIDLDNKRGYYGDIELNEEELKYVCKMYLFFQFSPSQEEFWGEVKILTKRLEKMLTSRGQSIR